MIYYQSESNILPIFITDNLKNWILEIIDSYNFDCRDINFFFCSDKYILQANRDFLDHDFYTDIITFDYCTTNVIAGDILISLDTVKSNSILFNVEYESELYRVIIHGILHLVGFKDATDDEKTEMRKMEDAALKILPTFL